MCLAVPMQVLETDGDSARCELGGVCRRVSLYLLQGDPPRPGDYVLVHVGYAIAKVAPEDAQAAWRLVEEGPRA